MSEHTAGPWQYRISEREGTVIGSEKREFIAKAYNNGDIAQTEANAALIAAAPELLAALESAEACLDEAHLDEGWNDDEDETDENGNCICAVHLEIRAAIAKARGQAVTQ